MQNTTHYNLKKPDYTDFADIQDINDNMDTIDAELAAPTGDGRDQTVSFTDADLDSGITSFPNFLTKIVSGMKLAKFIRDFKAGMGYVLHIGNLVNNATCTESGKALDARMGKTLQDQITSLNDSFYSTMLHSNASISVPTSSHLLTLIIGAHATDRNFIIGAYQGGPNPIIIEQTSLCAITATISNGNLVLQNPEDNRGYRCIILRR